jgi:hypothetical protein
VCKILGKEDLEQTNIANDFILICVWLGHKNKENQASSQDLARFSLMDPTWEFFTRFYYMFPNFAEFKCLSCVLSMSLRYRQVRHGGYLTARRKRGARKAGSYRG